MKDHKLWQNQSNYYYYTKFLFEKLFVKVARNNHSSVLLCNRFGYFILFQ